MSKARKALSRYRPLIGMAASLAAWFVLAFGYNKPVQLTPTLCVGYLIVIAGPQKPILLSGLSAAVGCIAGASWGLKALIQNLPSGDPVQLIGLLIGLGIAVLFYMVLFAVLGFIWAAAAKLYRQGAIF